jgi:site-specific DNA-methyltransferase (adenine-specific)
MKDIPDKSVDMILCDLPYGTTASAWDKNIDFCKLWEQYERIIKDGGAIALFGSGQFTYKLITSNEKLYKYKWIWFKSKRGNFVNAKNRPMTAYEEIMIFSNGNTANGSRLKMRYFPQGIVAKRTIRHDKSGTRFGTMAGKRPSHKETVVSEYTNYPCDVLQFASVSKPIHPTEKPIALLEYLVKTYTKEGETVLDNCMGSGSTGVACVNTKRNFIGIELDDTYFEIAENRIEQARKECMSENL